MSIRKNQIIPRNLTSFGEPFIISMIRQFPNENALFQLSKLTGMCEPLCRKITTRANPSMNQIRHLLSMCEVISNTSREFDENIMKAIRSLEEYENAHRRFYDSDMKRIRGRK